MDTHKNGQPQRCGSGNAKWVFLAFVAIAAYFLAMEHRAHLSGLASYLPFLLLLACPLMHLFMHGGHDHGGHRARTQDSGSKENET